MKQGAFCQVAVALPLADLFTYKIPEHLSGLIQTGSRVLVPFGRRRVTGYVIECCDTCTFEKVRDLIDLMDDEPLFDAERLALFRFVSDYYLQPLGEVIKTGLPAGINQASKTTWSLTEKGITALSHAGIAVKERRVLMCMDSGKSYEARQLRKLCDAATPTVIQKLADKDWLYKSDDLNQAATRAKQITVFAPNDDQHPLEVLERLRRSPKQTLIYQFLLEACQADASAISMAIPNPAAALSALVKSGAVVKSLVESYRGLDCAQVGAHCETVVLNAHQQSIVDRIGPELGAGTFCTYLIHGVTGSGKTEVYSRLAEKALGAGKTALVLVPEIALTPQLVSRFVKRFGNRIAVSHSGLSNPERYDQWRRMLRGEADLCIGTRSAIFSPMKNIGLIVVDEEHDPSYKQEDGVPYNGRDLAMVLGRNIGATVVLGSATPSLESYQAAQKGRYTLLELPERATESKLPDVHVVDLGIELALAKARAGKKQTQRDDETGSGPKSLPTATYAITRQLEKALEETLADGNQAILFLNRRGFSSHAFCLECRRSVMCPNCEVSLTPHLGGKTLHCHYCDHQMPANILCPHCGGRNFFLAGLGTEQVEQYIADKFPAAAIARLDRDTTARKGSLERILADFSQHKYDILVGTQIVTKGHDFPAVTLVGVLCADTGLYFPDFRSAERTFQLLSQVAGRSGRGADKGRVIVQTFKPDHYAIELACNHDYSGFFKRELERRGGPMYPPFTRVALLRVTSKSGSQAKAFVRDIADHLRESVSKMQLNGVRVLGPTVSTLSKIKGRFRFQILIKADTPSKLLSAAKTAITLAESGKQGDIEWRVDIDPQSVL